ncbi:MAG: DinB family protein [Brevefilum sp.]|nr:DinB family protein [Brevefilum sp.]MDT8381885.1 DinB family protein [Brevefilum sp.]
MSQEQEKIIKNFNDSLLAFNAVLEKVPVEGINWSEKEGKWTVRHVIHHVAEDCNVYAFIIERALAIPGSKVVFGDFPGNDIWAERLGFGERPVEPAIELMHAHRKFLAELVSHFPDRWDNNVRFFDEEGKELATSSVKEMMVMLTEHMQEHTEMVSRILKANLE